MAITATLSVSPAGVKVGQPSDATVTVSNSGSSDVTVTSSELWATPYGLYDGSVSVMVGKLAPVVGGPSYPIVPAGSSLTLKTKVIIFDGSDETGLGNCENVYSIAGMVWTSDGSATALTATTLVQLDLANEAQRAVIDFSQTDRSQYICLLNM
jgi:hypothetical protein